MKSFIIVGGGASGVIMAAQLLRRGGRVVLFELTGQIGAGIAYSTENPNHLLNVRAGNMSAFPDDPDHFFNWLQACGLPPREGGWEKQSFVPRRLYRNYLESLLQSYLDAGDRRLVIHQDEIVDTMLEAGKPIVVTESGKRFSADVVIFATGNEPSVTSSGSQVSEYWTSNGMFDIAPDQTVAIFGTGLSMVDSVLSLLDRGHQVPIHAISRRGLLPARHTVVVPAVIEADELSFGAPLSRLMQTVRVMIRKTTKQGGDWRSIIDGLRPHSQKLWHHLSLADKQRFLRHLRPWWDVHRHRMAPEVADRIDKARQTGQLIIRSGYLQSVSQMDTDMLIRYRNRYGNDVTELRVSTIIDCRGGNLCFSVTRNRALLSLLERGLARPDQTDLGFDVTPELKIVNAMGEAANPLYAIGPLTKGVYWEVTAIPDIRVQAEKLANALCATD
ncbi:FAD/NAD(P)-binding protein [Daeguia caeni]|uniref:FAD/NAD(P)-binding protein n=1 Tax=Daeguia caeni TaxID=439612 RepID=A0ABV9H5F9_9HYPH